MHWAASTGAALQFQLLSGVVVFDLHCIIVDVDVSEGNLLG
jgi:hypothetical protein